MVDRHRGDCAPPPPLFKTKHGSCGQKLLLLWLCHSTVSFHVNVHHEPDGTSTPPPR